MSKPPLWEVMQDAGSNAPGTPRDAIAAEIRAIAKWIEQRQIENYLATVPRPHHTDVPKVIRWLTAEANRAERGEVEHG